MENASKILYKIGIIINVIAVPLLGIFIVYGATIFMIAYAPRIGYYPSSRNKNVDLIYPTICILCGIHLFAAAILSMNMCSKKREEIDNGSLQVAPSIYIIVFGAIAYNIFFVISGIFSLIIRNREMEYKKSKEIG